MAELFAAMKAAGLTPSLDVNDDPDDRWDGDFSTVFKSLDVIFVNERECKKLSGVGELNEATGRLAAIVPLVVVKLGQRGALTRRGQEEWRAEGSAGGAGDPGGAGGSF